VARLHLERPARELRGIGATAAWEATRGKKGRGKPLTRGEKEGGEKGKRKNFLKKGTHARGTDPAILATVAARGERGEKKKVPKEEEGEADHTNSKISLFLLLFETEKVGNRDKMRKKNQKKGRRGRNGEGYLFGSGLYKLTLLIIRVVVWTGT